MNPAARRSDKVWVGVSRGETVEFLNQGESTVHMTGYTVESEFSDDEFDTADSVANGSESASESDGDVPSDEEHRAIMEDMKRQQELGTFDAEFSDGEEDGVEGTEDEEEDEDEGSDEEEPEGKADGVEGTGSDEDEDESSDESSDEEEDEVIAEPPIKKAKKEGKGTPQAPAAKKAKQQPKESMQPAPAAEPRASTVAPLPKSSSSSSSSSSSTAKPQPNTADGKAALETWFAAVATFIQANPGAKLNMVRTPCSIRFMATTYHAEAITCSGRCYFLSCTVAADRLQATLAGCWQARQAVEKQSQIRTCLLAHHICHRATHSVL